MVHSVELLLDTGTESAVRRVWESLSDAGLHSPAPTSRPHVTVVVADAVSPDVDARLSPITARLPLPCVIGAPMLFGFARGRSGATRGRGGPLVLVRLVVPSAPLLALQAEVLETCLPYLDPGPAPNTLAGQWTPHVTLARRVEPADLAVALSRRGVSRDITATIVGLRRWDGNKRVEHLIG